VEYRVVFDIADAGYKSWPFPTFGLLFVAMGLLMVVYRTNLPVLAAWRGHPRLAAAFSYFVLGFAVLWTSLTFYSTYHEYLELAAARTSNEARIVEGVVTNFRPMPITGHAMESFCVNRGNCFDYSDNVITAGFNNTSSHGGPIREGLNVRVMFVGNSIVRLEVAR